MTKIKRNIKKWLKALRSGCYAQGRGCLVQVKKEGDFFCCLGVAIEEVEKEPPWDKEPQEEEIWGSESSESIKVLSLSFGNDFSVPCTSWWVPNFGLMPMQSYAKLNDDGLSFDEIADRIEADAKKRGYL